MILFEQTSRLIAGVWELTNERYADPRTLPVSLVLYSEEIDQQFLLRCVLY